MSGTINDKPFRHIFASLQYVAWISTPWRINNKVRIRFTIQFFNLLFEIS